MQTLEKVATFNGEENIPEEVGLGLKIDFLKNGLEKEHCGFTVLDGGGRVSTLHSPCDQTREEKEKPGNDWK